MRVLVYAAILISIYNLIFFIDVNAEVKNTDSNKVDETPTIEVPCNEAHISYSSQRIFSTHNKVLNTCMNNYRYSNATSSFWGFQSNGVISHLEGKKLKAFVIFPPINETTGKRYESSEGKFKFIGFKGVDLNFNSNGELTQSNSCKTSPTDIISCANHLVIAIGANQINTRYEKGDHLTKGQTSELNRQNAIKEKPATVTDQNGKSCLVKIDDLYSETINPAKDKDGNHEVHYNLRNEKELYEQLGKIPSCKNLSFPQISNSPKIKFIPTGLNVSTNANPTTVIAKTKNVPPIPANDKAQANTQIVNVKKPDVATPPKQVKSIVPQNGVPPETLKIPEEKKPAKQGYFVPNDPFFNKQKRKNGEYQKLLQKAPASGTQNNSGQ